MSRIVPVIDVGIYECFVENMDPSAIRKLTVTVLVKADNSEEALDIALCYVAQENPSVVVSHLKALARIANIYHKLICC